MMLLYLGNTWYSRTKIAVKKYSVKAVTVNKHILYSIGFVNLKKCI